MRIAAISALLLFALPAAAQDKTFKLRYFGLSYFQLETPSGKKLVFDPHAVAAFGAAKGVSADVILTSHRHPIYILPQMVEGHTTARIFDGLKPGAKGKGFEFNAVDEKVGVFRVRSVGTFRDADDGKQRGPNAAWVVTAEDLTVCHLGNLGHELTPAQVKSIGPIDVLLVPVGGVTVLNGDGAKAVTKALKPRLFALPMHYGTPDFDDLLTAEEYLDGQPNVRKTPTTNELVINPAKKPETHTVAVLGWAGK